MCQGRIRRMCRRGGLRNSTLEEFGAQECGECSVGFFGYACSVQDLLEGWGGMLAGLTFLKVKLAMGNPLLGF